MSLNIDLLEYVSYSAIGIGLLTSIYTIYTTRNNYYKEFKKDRMKNNYFNKTVNSNKIKIFLNNSSLTEEEKDSLQKLINEEIEKKLKYKKEKLEKD